jgi:hypothetical protein
MDDQALHKFFANPTQLYHRQYEAARAVVMDGRSQKEVAEEFGFQYHSLRQLIYELRQSLKVARKPTESPFFKLSKDTDGL